MYSWRSGSPGSGRCGHKARVRRAWREPKRGCKRVWKARGTADLVNMKVGKFREIDLLASADECTLVIGSVERHQGHFGILGIISFPRSPNTH